MTGTNMQSTITNCEDTEKVATEISELLQRMKARDIEMRQEADNKGKGYRYYFKVAAAGFQYGVDAAVRNICAPTYERAVCRILCHHVK
jgi:hypothetical protein